ncbi:MAG: HAD-IIA family hydrolase [Chloroflexota bacterium]|nr:HAD-IIA family hydrolase [Chloroflexota bacterium]
MTETVSDAAAIPLSPTGLQDAKAFIFDMDGVLYRGRAPLPGVADLFNALTLRGVPFLLATNNSMATPASYVLRMAEMGVEVDEARIQTSATVTRDYLLGEIEPRARIVIVGMPALAEQIFTGTSFQPVTDDADSPVDAVVVGLDLEFTYAKLRRASDAVRGGAKYVATNADATLPHETGMQPGAGSIVAAISTASGRLPIVVGKPETLMMLKGIEQLGVQPEEAVMVGDRLDTDILSGNRAGLKTALVLTGVSQRPDLVHAEVLPDYVFADLPALTQALVGPG